METSDQGRRQEATEVDVYLLREPVCGIILSIYVSVHQPLQSFDRLRINVINTTFLVPCSFSLGVCREVALEFDGDRASDLNDRS